LTIAGGEWSAVQLGKVTPYPLNRAEHFVCGLQNTNLGVKDFASSFISREYN
jgi:hypothetical protein